jgi:glycosyltransferase involved in cell wall biosynthesis
MTDTQTRPLVSIIVIFLNAEKFLDDAIESVFEQTYDHWELLLIDDGSHDCSTTIAQHLAAQYPGQVRYLEHAGHQNLGKSTSRNLGILQARGEYITFLDADDVLLSDKLARQVAILASHSEAGMVYGRTLYWHSWTGKPKDRRRDVLGKLGVRSNTLFQPPTLLTRFLRDGGTVPCLCSMLARRRIVLGVGGFEETIQHLYEDQVFLAKMCLATPVYVESGCGERYRQHPDSSSAIAIRTGEYHPLWPNPARDVFVRWLVQYISAQGIQDTALQRALQKALRPFQYPNVYRLIKLVSSPTYLLGLRLRSYTNIIMRRLFPRRYTYDL